MTECRIRILQITQSDPARQEFAFDGFLTLGEAMGAGNLVAGLGIALVVAADRMARHDAALRPPGLGVSHFRGVAGDGCENGPGLRIVFLLAIEAGESIFHANRFAHRGLQGRVFLVGAGLAAQQFLRHGGSFLIFAGQAFGGTDGAVGFLRINQPPHALLVVVGTQQIAEFSGHGLFQRRIDPGIVPDTQHVLACRVAVTIGDQRAGQRQRAFRRHRLAFRKVIEDQLGRFGIHIK